MADQNVKIYLIEMKIVTRGFRGCRLQVFTRNFEIQYGGLKWKKLLDSDEIGYSGVFGVAECIK